MKEAFFKFYGMLGNTKGQKFRRFMELIALLAICIMLIVNVGYKDGKWYWKPADVSFKAEK
mgnify:CR=1 FL=1